MAIDVAELIRKEREYQESIKPVDVQVLLGGRLLTVRVPYMSGSKFNDLASRYPARETSPRGPYDLHRVMREYPDVVLIDGDEQDDLYVLRDREAFYRWPEVYDALGQSDQESLQAVIWGLHIYMPQQRMKDALKARADKTREEGTDNA